MSAPQLNVFVNGQGTVTADNLNTFWQTCDNMAQLRNLVGIQGVMVYVRGTTSPADGGQGAFYWNANGTAPDDNGVTTVVPYGSGSGEWTRIGVSEAMNPVVAATTIAQADQLLGLTPFAAVVMQQINGVWTVFLPTGAILNTSASTTQGLQEAVNAACTSVGTTGYDLYVIGGDAKTGGAVVINCTTSVTIPPTQGKKISIGAVTINFQSTVTGGGLIFDSQEMLDFDMSGGQIVSEITTAPAVYFNPTNPTPIDGLLAITSSRIYIKAVAIAASASGPNYVVAFNTDKPASIGGNEIIFGEINGAGASNSSPAAAVGIFVYDPPANASFEANIIRIAQIHLVNLYGIQLGTGGGTDSNILNNVWDVGGIECDGPNTTIGINTYGSGDTFTVGEITFGQGTGSMSHAVLNQSGANGNQFSVGGLRGGAGPYSSVSTGENWVYGALLGANVNTSPGIVYTPDGTIYQYITSASSNVSGVFTSFHTSFNTLLTAIATPNSAAVAIKALATTSGITITSATSANPTCYVWAMGR